MYLQRIRVPNFRVLKNVDITFEKNFFPKVFPLGSLNGGGKSTLLQLVFTLIHCSFNQDRQDRTEFVRNLIDNFELEKDVDENVVAIIDIWDGDKDVTLEFFCCRKSHIKEFSEELMQSFGLESYKLISEKIDALSQEIYYLQNKINLIQRLQDQIESGTNETEKISESFYKFAIENEELFNNYFVEEKIHESDKAEILYLFSNLKKVIDWRSENLVKLFTLYRKILVVIKNSLNIKNAEFKEFQDKRLYTKLLIDERIIYICDILSDPSTKQDNPDTDKQVFFCRISDNLDIREVDFFLSKMSEKIFFAAHLSQVFLFTSVEERKKLFNKQSNSSSKDNYYTYLSNLKLELPGFFTYDFIDIDILVNSFVKARDLDFLEAVKTGEYGLNYKRLQNDLNLLLNNKKVNVSEDLKGLTFKNINGVDLYPEDLSHGELKRLCIYMWFKQKNIQDAIVLMDEIEIAFHPDWQYEIVEDIQQWVPTNQYILATHSYNVCEAVTPAHVKELEPKLLSNQKSD